MTQWGKKLRATTSEFLLLRGALEDEDGGLMAKLMAATVLDGAQNAETRPANEVTTPSGVAVGQEAAEALPDPSRMPEIHESYEMGPITTQSDNQNPQTATPQQGVLRRRTSQLESAPVQRTNTITGPDPSSERSQLLRAVFGPNALAHREMRIDIVTAVSVLVISVKTFSNSLIVGVFERRAFHHLWLATSAVAITHISFSRAVRSRYGKVYTSGPQAGCSVKRKLFDVEVVVRSTPRALHWLPMLCPSFPI
jgi:hypothetical protein